MQRTSNRFYWNHIRGCAVNPWRTLFAFWKNIAKHDVLPRISEKHIYEKKHLSKRKMLSSWDTRTRTRNDRTRICSVTITPYPNFAFKKNTWRWSWDTRTRTRNDRTRICSVTITPYPNIIAISSTLFLNCGCKGTTFFWITKIFRHFFLKNLNFFCFLWLFRVFSVSLYHHYI